VSRKSDQFLSDLVQALQTIRQNPYFLSYVGYKQKVPENTTLEVVKVVNCWCHLHSQADEFVRITHVIKAIGGQCRIINHGTTYEQCILRASGSLRWRQPAMTPLDAENLHSFVRMHSGLVSYACSYQLIRLF